LTVGVVAFVCELIVGMEIVMGFVGISPVEILMRVMGLLFLGEV